MTQKEKRRRKRGPRPGKRPVTIRLDLDTLYYFLELADETWIPYQTLINLYLRDCADQEKLLDLSWHPRQQRTLDELDAR